MEADYAIEVRDNRVAGQEVINTWYFQVDEDVVKIVHEREFESYDLCYVEEEAVIASDPEKRLFSREEARKIYRAVMKKGNAIASDLVGVTCLSAPFGITPADRHTL